MWLRHPAWILPPPLPLPHPSIHPIPAAVAAGHAADAAAVQAVRLGHISNGAAPPNPRER